MKKYDELMEMAKSNKYTSENEHELFMRNIMESLKNKEITDCEAVKLVEMCAETQLHFEQKE